MSTEWSDWQYCWFRSDVLINCCFIICILILLSVLFHCIYLLPVCWLSNDKRIITTTRLCTVHKSQSIIRQLVVGFLQQPLQFFQTSLDVFNFLSRDQQTHHVTFGVFMRVVGTISSAHSRSAGGKQAAYVNDTDLSTEVFGAHIIVNTTWHIDPIYQWGAAEWFTGLIYGRH